MNEEARKRNLSKSKKQKLQVKKDYQFDCNISFDCFDELKKQPARSKSGVRVQLHKEELLKEQVADYQQIRQKQVRLESAITVQDNYTRDDFEVQHIQQAHDNQIHIPVGDLKQYEKFQSDLVIIPNINQNPVQNQQEDFIQEHNIIVENEESEDFIEGEHAHIEKRQIKRTQLLEAEKDMLKQINSTVQEGIVNYKQCIHYEQNYHNEKFQEHNKGHSVNVQYQSSGGGNMMINDGYVGKGLDGHIAKGFEKKYTDMNRCMDNQMMLDEAAAVNNNFYGMKSYKSTCKSTAKSSGMYSSNKNTTSEKYKNLPKDFGNFELDFIEIRDEDLKAHKNDKFYKYGNGHQSMTTKSKDKKMKKKQSGGGMYEDQREYGERFGLYKPYSTIKDKMDRNDKFVAGYNGTQSYKDNTMTKHMANYFGDNSEDEDLNVNPEFEKQANNFQLEDVFTLSGNQLLEMPFFSQ